MVFEVLGERHVFIFSSFCFSASFWLGTLAVFIYRRGGEGEHSLCMNGGVWEIFIGLWAWQDGKWIFTQIYFAIGARLLLRTDGMGDRESQDMFTCTTMTLRSVVVIHMSFIPSAS